MKRFAAQVAGIALAGLSMLASAQATYPTKTIRMIVPFAAGGPTDITARALAQKMTDSMGQPVVIENRGGSGGNIATEIVAREPGRIHAADGDRVTYDQPISLQQGPLRSD